MNLVIKGHNFLYETENLLRVFFPTEKIESTTERTEEERYIITSLSPLSDGSEIEIKISLGEEEKTEKLSVFLKDKDEKESDEAFLERSLEVFLYGILCKETEYTPPWGILTGVRPAKLMTNLVERTARKLSIQREELKKCADREQLKLYGELIVANLYQLHKGTSFYEVQNYYDNCKLIKIPCDPALSPTENQKKYYK